VPPFCSSPQEATTTTIIKKLETTGRLTNNTIGELNYAKALGHQTLDPDSAQFQKPMQLNTVFALASATKLLTSIALCQLIERRVLTPDTDVSPYLPTLASEPIITGIDPSTKQPTFTERTKPILLRHLLTHSSGLGYSFFQPLVAAWLETLADDDPSAAPKFILGGGGDPKIEDRLRQPLVFEPGTSWAYGTGIDWAGKLLEVVTGQNLDDYVRENILVPAGVDTSQKCCPVTFYPERHPILDERRAGITVRSPLTNRAQHTALPTPSPDRDAYGGESCCGDLGEYVKVMYSLLVDDGKLVKPETASELIFGPWLKEPEAKEALNENMETPEWAVGHVPRLDSKGAKYDWSLAGLLTDGDGHGYRRSGFLQWGGAFGVYWVSCCLTYSCLTSCVC